MRHTLRYLSKITTSSVLLARFREPVRLIIDSWRRIFGEWFCPLVAFGVCNEHFDVGNAQSEAPKYHPDNGGELNRENVGYTRLFDLTRFGDMKETWRNDRWDIAACFFRRWLHGWPFCQSRSVRAFVLPGVCAIWAKYPGLSRVQSKGYRYFPKILVTWWVYLRWVIRPCFTGFFNCKPHCNQAYRMTIDSLHLIASVK